MAKADPSPPKGEVDKTVAYFKDEIETYERQFDKWLRRCRKIMKKYRDMRSPREEAVVRYNILWANVQTRLPALYARNPKVVVERRYRDADPIGRVASEILERSIEYTLEHCNDAWQVNRQVVLDYELPGRGTVWVRYVPHFKRESLPQADAEKRPGDTERGAGITDPTVGELEGANLSTTLTGEAAQPQAAAIDDQERPHSSDLELKASGAQISNEADDEVMEETLEYEETKLDYVYWEDYGHTWARVDDEIRAKWRRVYMDREELEERFMVSEENPEGLTEEEIAAIPLDWSPKTLTDAKIPITRKKAIVYEIWDKRRREVLWMVKNYPKLLDRRDDMLGLVDFFPCPRMLAANLCNDDLIPTPNYTYYQDQANEVDELSTRIGSITKALKVCGVRDTSAEGLDRLLSEGVENQLIPVDGWAALKEKGGLAGTFELLPIDMIADCLDKLTARRTALIEDIYQLTGISDIVRGMSDPTETATAQQLKGQFSMVRIEDAQAEVQRFCRDEIRIIGQIVASYSIDTLKAISGIKLLTAAEKQQMQIEIKLAALAAQAQSMQAQQAQAAGASHPQPAAPGAPAAPAVPAPSAMAPQHPASAPQGPPQGAPQPPPQAMPHPMSGAMPPVAPAPQQAPQPGGQMHPGAPSAAQQPASGQAPLSPEKMKLLEQPTWEEVEALLKNPVLREFRLDIETDSTIRMDEDAEKAARIELITAVGGFIQQAIQAGSTAPEIMPMLGELLMFGIRAFKTARAVEQTFEDMMEALIKASKQPKGPPPEVQKAQVEGQQQLQLAQVKADADLKVAQGTQAAQAQQTAQENQLEAQRKQHQAQLDFQLEQQKAQLQARTQTQIEELKNHFEAQKAQWETAAQERIAHIDNAAKIRIAEIQAQHAAAEGDKQRAHERDMTQRQHEHEKSMPKPEPKAA